MLENFKTDIIYYDTASDFELEFNLCGCCRMRLFNDKCSDKKSLLLSLSRAVSRSRVIIVTTSLFGENNIFKTVASAIGSDTETIDNSQYNIASDTEITVIKGSLPLVTEDGIFGGCIIESGPQSLIVLTDNQAVRKTLMKNLIHPYIKEIASGNDDAPSHTEIITDQDLPEAETDDIEENTPDTESDALITDEDYDTDAQDGIDTGYYSEDEQLFTDTFTDATDSEDNDYYDDGDYYIDSAEEKSSAFNIWMLIISIILLVGLTILCYCIFYVPTKAGISPSAYLKDVFDTMFK
ncbi:MAG: hypothetical protein IJD45_01445 [Clostridia bacterium]|nr:hypothetical protein [Clostridia bacterium]